MCAIESTTDSGTRPSALRRYLSQKPYGEPQLSKYGLYEALDGDVLPALWVLNFLRRPEHARDIATRASLPFDKIAAAADILSSRGLLKEVEP
jgi:aminopeptidase-like protein